MTWTWLTSRRFSRRLPVLAVESMVRQNLLEPSQSSPILA
jgi:hypothetical protein